MKGGAWTEGPIRRKNSTGYHYFILNLSPDDICENICLAVPFTKAAWFNPLNGDITPTTITGDSIYVNLHSGASMILQTYDNDIEMTASTLQPTREPVHSHSLVLGRSSNPKNNPRLIRPSSSTVSRLGRNSATTVPV